MQRLKKLVLGPVLVLGGAASSATAAPITYTDTLTSGEIRTDALPVTGTFDNPSSAVSDYYTFSGPGGATAAIVVWRTEEAFDPALWVFEGTFADTGAFAGGSDPRLDPLDLGFLAFGDDELPAPNGPFGDPLIWTRLTLPGNGSYTAIVTNFNSDPDDGDGVYPYRISLTIIPAPAGLPLLATGLAALALTRTGRRDGRRASDPRTALRVAREIADGIPGRACRSWNTSPKPRAVREPDMREGRPRRCRSSPSGTRAATPPPTPSAAASTAGRR